MPHTHSTDVVVADLPYGLGVEPWDAEVWPKDYLEQVLSVVKGNNQAPFFCIGLWCHWVNAADVHDALNAQGFKNICPIYWYKPNQTYVGPAGTYTRAVEIMVTATYPSATAQNTHFDKNPVKRHNFIQHDAVRQYHIGLRPRGRRSQQSSV